jgi:hypothetical protein
MNHPGEKDLDIIVVIARAGKKYKLLAIMRFITAHKE